jgi:hypothetical protein
MSVFFLLRIENPSHPVSEKMIEETRIRERILPALIFMIDRLLSEEESLLDTHIQA